MGKHLRKTEEISIINPVFKPETRKWVYGVATAAVPLLVAYGVIEDATAPLWIALAAQVFATGTAWAHTPTESVGHDS